MSVKKWPRRGHDGDDGRGQDSGSSRCGVGERQREHFQQSSQVSCGSDNRALFWSHKLLHWWTRKKTRFCRIWVLVSYNSYHIIHIWYQTESEGEEEEEPGDSDHHQRGDDVHSGGRHAGHGNISLLSNYRANIRWEMFIVSQLLRECRNGRSCSLSSLYCDKLSSYMSS